MPHDANIIHTDVTQGAPSEHNSSECAATNESLSATSGNPPKAKPELFRFVDFLARYEARQDIIKIR